MIILGNQSIAIRRWRYVSYEICEQDRTQRWHRHRHAGTCFKRLFVIATKSLEISKDYSLYIGLATLVAIGSSM